MKIKRADLMKHSKKKRKSDNKKNSNNKEEQKEDIQESLRWYDEQIEKNPRDIKLYHGKAALLARIGQSEEAVATLDKILDFDPNNGRIWFDKGELLLFFERYKEAIDCFDMAVQLYPDYSEAWLGRGKALINLRSQHHDDLNFLDKKRKAELEDALDSFTLVSEKNPKSDYAWFGRGKALCTLKRYSEALPCFNKCLEINPSFIKGWYSRGKVLQKLNRDEEAIESFKNAISFSPNDQIMKDAEDWCARANSLYELGQAEEALECFDCVFERFPNNQFTLEAKGVIYELLGMKDKALRCYRCVVELNPKYVSSWFRMGNVLREIGDLDRALESYNNTITLTPDFEEAWYRVGELLKLQKNYEKANECFSWILQINPDNAKAKDAIWNPEEDNKKIQKDDSNKISIDEAKKTKLRKFRRKVTKTFIKVKEESATFESEQKKISPQTEETKKVRFYEDSKQDPSIEEEPEKPKTILEVESESAQEALVQKSGPSKEPQEPEDFDADLEEFKELLEKKADQLDSKRIRKLQESQNLEKSREEEKPVSDKVHVVQPNTKYIKPNQGHLDGHHIKDIQPDHEHLDGHRIENNQTYKGLSIEQLVEEGKKHLENKEYEKALGYLDRALELDPQHLDAWSLKGDALLETAKHKPDVEKLVKEGRMHLQKQDFEKAMVCFDRALELDPSHLDAWGLKGDTLLEKEKKEKR